MVFVFYGHERHQAKGVFDRLFKLRYTTFVVGRGWSLPSRNGREIDQYDTDEAVYFVDFDENGNIVAHVRLTPTTKSSLTADYFPHLVENGTDPRGDDVYEATRFIVLPSQTDKSRYRSIKAQLIAATVEWSMSKGVKHLQTVIDAGTLNAYVEMSTSVRPLGLAHPFGGGKGCPGGGNCLVFRLPVTPRLLEELRTYGALTDNPSWQPARPLAA